MRSLRRASLALALCLAGLALIVAGIWSGCGRPAGLAASGVVAILTGLLFVDVDGADAPESDGE